ncbi:MAG: Cof-type HAD-IIB family hydrolase [Candidatus Accumulibacter sp.]|jgi:Cof subfamily protein (haloacid dehalogenase superfamily)|nr:Cof-type HAD-IIB family hydrolase [Accumulibacter sp.]
MEKPTNYRLIALDLDGTLLDSALRIRRDTIDALQRARDGGIEIMIATGRHHSAAHAYWKELDLELPAICCNGGYVYDFMAGRALAGDPYARPEARRMLDIVRAHPVDAMIYTDAAMTYENDMPHLQSMRQWSATLPEPVRPRLDRVDSLERVIDEAAVIWKFLIISEEPAFLDAFTQDARARGFDCVRSSRTRIDVARPGNSKGRRLSEFIAQRNILPREVIAFGDQDNDREMLQLAGFGVAMGNSRPDVRACADWVTGANDSDGIAEVLRRFVLAA